MKTKTMKKMAKKKSKGNDGISQECLILGHEALAGPLTNVINASINDGIFPDQWKEAIVVPILKKGDPNNLKNYNWAGEMCQETQKLNDNVPMFIKLCNIDIKELQKL